VGRSAENLSWTVRHQAVTYLKILSTETTATPSENHQCWPPDKGCIQVNTDGSYVVEDNFWRLGCGSQR
jgi:hypothetical protein